MVGKTEARLVISYNKSRRKKRRREDGSTDDHEAVKKQKKVCQFCLSGEDNEVEYGVIHEKENVTVHYFCMLLSSGLCQNARISDKRGILGFLLSDIKKEISRGNRLKCCFCHGKGATIGCCVKTCKRVFHLSCGRQHGTMHQFFDNFRSFCVEHRLCQDQGCDKANLRIPGKSVCAICMSTIATLAFDIMFPPCCKRSWFHRTCLQQYAISAGKHYFKCPLCNSVEDFQSDMLQYGIYIPDQDASWEREPHAFQELLERHDTCDAAVCYCPHGRKHDADSGKFELLLCEICGSFGSHRACVGLERRGAALLCTDCAEIGDIAVEKRKKEAAKAVAKRRESKSPKRKRAGNTQLPSSSGHMYGASSLQRSHSYCLGVRTHHSQVRLRSRQTRVSSVNSPLTRLQTLRPRRKSQ